jgi:hypothetical protein
MKKPNVLKQLSQRMSNRDTFIAPEGYKMTQIKITLAINNKKLNLVVTINRPARLLFALARAFLSLYLSLAQPQHPPTLPPTPPSQPGP